MLVDWGIPIRWACKVLKFDTSTFQYKSRRTGPAPLERRIKEICETRVRYGYRRVHVHLFRDGWKIHMKRTRRIYRGLGLQLRNKHPKRRVKAKLRDDRQEAVGPNDVWTMDFVHDQLATGKKLRILTVVDTHSRYCPATDARFPYRGEDVVQTLEGICRKTGYPMTVRGKRCSEATASWGSPLFGGGRLHPLRQGSAARVRYTLLTAIYFLGDLSGRRSRKIFGVWKVILFGKGHEDFGGVRIDVFPT